MRDNNSLTRLKISALAVFACITCFAPSAARKPSASNHACPTISCESLTHVQPIQFTVDGGSNNTTYHWTVSSGNITSGQDTNQISVSNVPEGQPCEATVTMTGVLTGCSNELTCTTTIGPADAELVAKYDRNSPKDEIDRSLEKVVAPLTRNPQLIAYIVVYPGAGNTARIDSLHPFSQRNLTVNAFDLTLRRYEAASELFRLTTFQQPGQGKPPEQRPNKERDDPLPEAKRFAEFAKRYLIDRGVAADRLKIQFGPARQTLTVELYIGQRDGNLPSLYHPRSSATNPASLVPPIEGHWSLADENFCKDVFGSGVNKGFYCIRITLMNTTNYSYYVRGLAFKGSGGPPPKLSPIPIAPYSMVRGAIEPRRAQSIWQLLFFADKSFFHLRAMADETFRNDDVTRTTFLHPKSSVHAFVFVQKKLLNLPPKERNEFLLVFKELGDLVIDGDFYTPYP